MAIAFFVVLIGVLCYFVVGHPYVSPDRDDSSTAERRRRLERRLDEIGARPEHRRTIILLGFLENFLLMALIGACGLWSFWLFRHGGGLGLGVAVMLFIIGALMAVALPTALELLIDRHFSDRVDRRLAVDAAILLLTVALLWSRLHAGLR